MEVQWEDIDKRLRNLMIPERYAHAKRVGDVAERLALQYGADPKKARLAGIIHDCARDFLPSLLLQKAREFDILEDTVEGLVPVLLHAPVGAAIVEGEFGISDPEVLSAVRFHTTGKENMSVLDKIVFLADYIEPGRDFPGIEEVRQLAYSDLDKALLKALDASIVHIVQIGGFIHVLTIQCRNSLLRSLLKLGD